MERTTPAYQLPDALGDLAETISGLNTDRLNESLTTLAETFRDTPPDLRIAVEGVARFSQTLNERDAQLRDLLANASKVTTVLAERSDQVVEPDPQHQCACWPSCKAKAPHWTRSRATSRRWRSNCQAFVAENRAELRPALDKLNGVLTIVDNRKERVQKSIKLLNAYAMSLGESVSSGPFFKAYVANLLPGQFVQPFVDAAFSDLGLDPQCAAAVAADRPADRPAGNSGAAGAVPAHRPGRRAAPHPARRDHRQAR